jgi:hypothetical protein
MAIDAATLLHHIEESFGRVPYPGDEHIVADNSGWDPEYERPRTALRGRHWRDLPFETLYAVRSSLSFLSPEGYRFYLPAFMRTAIVDYDRADVLPSSVIGSLTLPHPSDMNVDWLVEWSRRHPEMQLFSDAELKEMQRESRAHGSVEPLERLFFEDVSGFDTRQREVIVEFLEYMRDVHGCDFTLQQPERALERYWYQFG